MTTQPDAPAPAVPPDRGKIIGAIAARMSDVGTFGTGPLAELRRLDPAGALAEPALHRLLARHVPESWLADAGLKRWSLVIHALALAAPDNLRLPARDAEPKETADQPAFWLKESRRAGQRFGTALLEAGLSERRLVNLLNASADELIVALPRVVRFLVAGGGRLPALAVLDLVMSAGDVGEESGRFARQRVARGYYRAEHKAETTEGAAA